MESKYTNIITMHLKFRLQSVGHFVQAWMYQTPYRDIIQITVEVQAVINLW